MKKKRITAIIVYIALLAVCLIAVYAVPSVRGLLEKTYVAEYGSLDITDEVSGFIVRDETVYVASTDGTIERQVEEGNLVKANTQIVELTADPVEEDEETKSEDADDTVTVSNKYRNAIEALGDNVVSTESGKTKIAGYVSYFVDGAEADLSTDKLDSLRMSDYEELTDLKSVETPSKSYKKGEPVFKIASNHKWYLVIYMDKEKAERYSEGGTVKIDLAGNNVSVTVDSIQTGESLAKVTLSCKTFFDGFLEERSLDTTITLASAQGLMLKDESIVTNSDGQIGVFVKNKLGEHIFKPISLKADDGTNSVAYSDIYVDANGNFVETIETYDEIILEPSADDLESIGIVMEEGDEGSEESSESEQND